MNKVVKIITNLCLVTMISTPLIYTKEETKGTKETIEEFLSVDFDELQKNVAEFSAEFTKQCAEILDATKKVLAQKTLDLKASVQRTTKNMPSMEQDPRFAIGASIIGSGAGAYTLMKTFKWWQGVPDPTLLERMQKNLEDGVDNTYFLGAFALAMYTLANKGNLDVGMPNRNWKASESFRKFIMKVTASTLGAHRRK